MDTLIDNALSETLKVAINTELNRFLLFLDKNAHTIPSTLIKEYEKQEKYLSLFNSESDDFLSNLTARLNKLRK